MGPQYTISQLARAANVAPSTVRFYERRGLLRPSGRTAHRTTGPRAPGLCSHFPAPRAGFEPAIAGARGPVSKLRAVRFYSVDVFGNAERPQRLHAGRP